MKRLAVLAALLLVAAQDPPKPQDLPGADKPEEPPMPGGKLPPKSGTPCCEEGRAKPWPLYNKGVQWKLPLEAAALEARKTGKLLMVFHLVGDMNKEGC